MRAQSLRARLIAIILTPLMVLGLAAAAWQFNAATKRAEEIFDRGLLSTALAISRDIAASDGDALSPKTRALINDTSGGEVFYHVYAPDGVFVIGYATPPVSTGRVEGDAPVYSAGSYIGRNVRVLQFRDEAVVSGLSGIFTITVWQDVRVRAAFVRDSVTRSFIVIAGLLAGVAIVVWFGVGLGLRPLLDLEDAIARRNPDDLEPIRRPVPIEAYGIVSTLNGLLGQVSQTLDFKTEFISNAAHQLRNPIAGVLALAEAVQSAKTSGETKERSADLVIAARETSHLANQLLSLERIKAAHGADEKSNLDLNVVTSSCHDRLSRMAEERGVAIDFTPALQSVWLRGDPVVLQEAIVNVMTNALVHGGSGLSEITVSLVEEGGYARLSIADNGAGIAAADIPASLERFRQIGVGAGSGLGLPIALAAVESHGGTLELTSEGEGLRVDIVLPLSRSSADKPALQTMRSGVNAARSV